MHIPGFTGRERSAVVHLLRRILVAVGVVAFYVVTAISFRENPPGAACFIAAVAILVFGAFVLWRSPSAPLNRAFFYFSLALGSHVLAVYLLHMAISWGIDRVRPTVWLLRNGSMLAPPALMFFTYRLTRSRSRLFLVLTRVSFLSMLPLMILNLAGRYLLEFRKAKYTYVPAEPLSGRSDAANVSAAC